jgi:flagellar motor switch protein FliM
MPDADKILSQHEVDALLSAIDGNAGDSGGEVSAEPYDFRRPSRIPAGPLRFIHAIHEAFARSLPPALSGMLLKPVEARLSGVHQLPLGEFVSSLPRPAVLVVLSAEPLEGVFLMSINPSIAGPLVERLLGAGKIVSGPRERPLSPLEWNVADTMIQRLLELLGEAWAPLGALRFEVLSRESDPQSIRIETVNEPSVAVTVEIAMGDQRGSLDLLFPAMSIEPHLAKMVPATPFAARRPAEASSEDLTKRLSPAEVEVGVQLPPGRIKMRDLEALRPGDYVVTSHPHADPVWVSIEGRRKFLARLGSLKDRKAAKIVAPAEGEGGPEGQVSVIRSGDGKPGPSGLKESLRQLSLEATVVLAEKRVGLKDVMGLKPGDVMEFGRAADDLLELRVSGRTIAEGTAVRIGEQFGLKVTSMKAGGP